MNMQTSSGLWRVGGAVAAFALLAFAGTPLSQDISSEKHTAAVILNMGFLGIILLFSIPVWLTAKKHLPSYARRLFLGTVLFVLALNIAVPFLAVILMYPLMIVSMLLALLFFIAIAASASIG